MTVKPDSTGGTRVRKVRPRPEPILQPDALYLWADIRESFGLNSQAVKLWRQHGLRVRQPGTKRAFVYGREILEVIVRVSDAN